MYLLLTDTGGHAGWLTLAWEIKHLLLERLTKQFHETFHLNDKVLNHNAFDQLSKLSEKPLKIICMTQ